MMLENLICVNSPEITDINPGVYFSVASVRKSHLYHYFVRSQVRTCELKGVAANFTSDTDLLSLPVDLEFFQLFLIHHSRIKFERKMPFLLKYSITI